MKKVEIELGGKGFRVVISLNGKVQIDMPSDELGAWLKMASNHLESCREREEKAQYEHVMDLLRNLKMEHGLCKPRSRRACTNCNSREELERIVARWKGLRIYAT